MVGWYLVAGFASRVNIAVFVSGVAFVTTQVRMHPKELEARMGFVAQVALSSRNNTRLP